MVDKDNRYDFLIVGGGPASLSFLINVTRNGKLFELISNRGLAIIEKGQSFGSGNIDSYMVGSKQNASQLIDLFLKEPDCRKTRRIEEYLNSDSQTETQKDKNTFKEPSKGSLDIQRIYDYDKLDATLYEKLINNIEGKSISIFREVLETKAFHEILKNYRNSCAPLSLIGYIMKLMGNTLLRHIKTIKNKFAFKPNIEVQGIQLMTNGEILVQCQDIQMKEDVMSLNEGPTIAESYRNFVTKVLILAPGGYQEKIKMKSVEEQRIFGSEEFMTENCFLKASSIIRARTEKSPRKIYILAKGKDMNDAFRCANLLINGPLIFDVSERAVNSKGSFITKRPERCAMCCRCEILRKIQEKNEKKKSLESLKEKHDALVGKKKTEAGYSQIHNGKLGKLGEGCKCDCYCCGSILPRRFDKYLNDKGKIPFYEPGEIIVMHEKDITVFYENQVEAKRELGKKYMEKYLDANGQLNSTYGLHGEAKLLYYKIRDKEENRIQIIKKKEEHAWDDLVKEACLVVQCYERKSHTIPFRDNIGNKIKILYDEEQGSFQVDEQLRISTEQGSLTNIYVLAPGLEKILNNKDEITKFSKITNYDVDHLHKEISDRIIKGALKGAKIKDMGTEWFWYQNEENISSTISRNSEAEFETSSFVSDIVESEAVNINTLTSAFAVDKLFPASGTQHNTQKRVHIPSNGRKGQNSDVDSVTSVERKALPNNI